MVRTTAEEANKELTKTESKMRGELGDLKSSMSSKVDTDVGAVRKQVERVLDTSLEQFEELLGQTARRDDVVKALASKADKSEVEDKVEALKTHVKRTHDGIAQQLVNKVEVQTFDKKFSALDEGVSNQEQVRRAAWAV